jgi:hypothetical protein
MDGKTEINQVRTLAGIIDLVELKNLIDEKEPICICGSKLAGHNIKHYGPHSGGDFVKGYNSKRWIYVHCDSCNYDMALWKIKREL